MKKLSWLFEKFPKYLFAAILVIVPLFPKFPLIDVPGTYVSIRFEDLLLLILGIITFTKISLNLKTFLKDKIFVSLLIFFGISFLSVLSGAFVTQTIDLKLGIFHFVRRIEYITPFLGALILLKKENLSEDVSYFTKTLMIVMFVAFLYGVGQRYLSFPIIVTQNQEYSKGIALRYTPGSHINSTFAGHYDLASFVVLVLPVFIALIFTIKDKLNALVLTVVSAGSLWLLINSISRIAQVSYIVAVAGALLLIKKFKALALVVVISLFFISMSSDLDARFMRVIEVYFGKSVTFIENQITAFAQEASSQVQPVFEDRSTSIRLNVEWPRAIRAFTKNPILGTGYSSIGLATDNDYLRMLGETGILGFLAFGLVIAKIGKVFFDSFPFVGLGVKERSFVVGIIGGALGTFLTCVFIDLFEASKFAILFWLLLGFAVNLVRNKDIEYKN